MLGVGGSSEGVKEPLHRFDGSAARRPHDDAFELDAPDPLHHPPVDGGDVRAHAAAALRAEVGGPGWG